MDQSPEADPKPQGQFTPLNVTAEDIVHLRDAIVIPQKKGQPNAASQASGVLDSDGNFVPQSITWRMDGGAFNHQPEMPAEEEIHEIQGTYMFAGPFYGHFGHFLTDSLARIWALDHIKPKLSGVIFTPKHNGRNVEHVLRTYEPLYKSFGLDCFTINTRIPLRVERLIVPPQGIGLDEWSLAAPVYRDFMAKHGGSKIEPLGGKKLYISRSELPVKRSSILAEKTIEEYLRNEGYEIFHPQKASPEEQIARYKAAEYIISPDGSPLHMLAYVGNKNQKVAVLVRRSNDTSKIFEAQLRAFNDCFAMTINAMRYDWLPRGHKEPNRLSWGEVDISKLYAPLRDNGFITGSTPWQPVEKSEILKQLHEISKAEQKSMHRYDPALGHLSVAKSPSGSARQ